MGWDNVPGDPMILETHPQIVYVAEKLHTWNICQTSPFKENQNKGQSCKLLLPCEGNVAMDDNL